MHVKEILRVCAKNVHLLSSQYLDKGKSKHFSLNVPATFGNVSVLEYNFVKLVERLSNLSLCPVRVACLSAVALRRHSPQTNLHGCLHAGAIAVGKTMRGYIDCCSIRSPVCSNVRYFTGL